MDIRPHVEIADVGERAREHPVGQPVDELGRFGQRQEPLGCEEPVHRVLPANECLDRVELSVGEGAFGW